MRRNVKRFINWKDPEQRRAYKRDWQRRDRGGVSWDEYVSRVKAEAVARKELREQQRAAQPPRVRKPRQLKYTKEFFSDMPSERVSVSMGILRELGK